MHGAIRLVTGLAVAAALLAACGAGATAPTATASLTGAPLRETATASTTSVGSPPAGTSPAGLGSAVRTLAADVVALPAAGSFTDPGFHFVVSIQANIPDGVTAGAGARLVVALRDATRPGQTCNQDHPLSGCVTIDWSDATGRPHVPDGGVFENRVTIRGEGVEQTYYLSESGALHDAPDTFDPG